MLIELLEMLTVLLLATSVVLGLVSTFFAGRRTIWQALGLWGLGLGAGLSGIALFLEVRMLQGTQQAALRAAGEPIRNDMPFFGPVLLGGFGCLFFAALLALIVMGLLVSVLQGRKSRDPI